MPNHVTNYLSFEGDPEQIKALIDKGNGLDKNGNSQIFTFNAFVPMPSEVYKGSLGREEELQYPGELNWYRWSHKYWGTKWDCYQVKVFDKGLCFETAWTVPFPVLTEISKQFPDVLITDEWIEETNESAGIIAVMNGRTICEAREGWLMWNLKQSRFIHPLNVKHNLQGYKQYLEDCARDAEQDDEEDPGYLRHYLALIEQQEPQPQPTDAVLGGQS